MSHFFTFDFSWLPFAVLMMYAAFSDKAYFVIHGGVTSEIKNVGKLKYFSKLLVINPLYLISHIIFCIPTVIYPYSLRTRGRMRLLTKNLL